MFFKEKNIKIFFLSAQEWVCVSMCVVYIFLWNVSCWQRGNVTHAAS